jgi:uncharacterized membrane protein
MQSLKRFLRHLRTSFWFVPLLIVAFSIALAVILIEVDSTGTDQWLGRWPRLFGADAAGARAVLSTIAGSMMTVVGITFSMTLVTLVLTSSQYSSRILRNFIRDRVTQVTLGVFAGIFTYCLIVLRTIRGGDETGFLAGASVSVGIVLAIGGIGVLVFFIHHIASSIQASSIIASVADETMSAVDRLFPERRGQEPGMEDGNQAVPPPVPQRWQTIPAEGNGYIESVDNTLLLHLAREYRTTLRMERGIGHFVIEGTPLVSLPLEAPADERIVAAVRAAYSIGRHRTLEQDCAFGIRQIVDVAMRALSPGMNDTTTAVMCVDYLTAILARLASRDIPSSNRYDEGQLRIIAIGQTFAGLVAESFDQIRGSAAGNVALMLRMLGALQTVAAQTSSPARRRVLHDQVQWIAELADRTIESPHDRSRFEDRLTRVREAITMQSVAQDSPG